MPEIFSQCWTGPIACLSQLEPAVTLIVTVGSVILSVVSVVGLRWWRQESRELRRIYKSAVRQTHLVNKLLRKELFRTFHAVEFWRAVISQGSTETEQKQRLRAMLSPRFPDLSEDQLIAAIDAVYKNILAKLPGAHNERWRTRYQEWSKAQEQTKERTRRPSLSKTENVEVLPLLTLGLEKAAGLDRSEQSTGLGSSSSVVFGYPPVPTGFIDRQEELVDLTKWFTADGGRLFFLGAPADRGKSYVAAKFYEQVRQTDNRHKHWINCSSRLKLDTLLDALGRNLPQPPDEESAEQNDVQVLRSPGKELEERVDAFLRMVGDEQWLFVFDDYQKVEDRKIDQFLKLVVKYSRTIKILVIASVYLSVFDDFDWHTEAVQEFQLRPLPKGEALAYLEKLGLRVDSQLAQRIWEKSAGEPTAMKIFALAARRRDLESLLNSSLLEWSPENVNAYLNELKNYLNVEEIQAAQAVSIFSEPVERSLLDHVCRSPQALNGLRDGYLLDCDVEGHLSLHSILKTYWNSQLGESATALHTRAAEWLEAQAAALQKSQEADRELRRTEYLRRSVFHWQEATNERKLLVCANALWESTLSLNERWDLNVKMWPIAQRIGDETLISRWLYNLGLVAEASGDGDAYRHYRDSLEICRRNRDIPLQVLLLRGLGRLDYLWRHYSEAEASLKESLELSTAMSDWEEEKATLRELAHLRITQGEAAEVREYEEAERWYREALELANQIGDGELAKQVLRNLSSLRDAQGEDSRRRAEYKQAEHFYREGLKIAEDISNDGLLLRAQVLGHLGLLYLAQHHLLQAGQFLTEAVGRFIDLDWVKTATELTEDVLTIDKVMAAELKRYLEELLSGKVERRRSLAS